MNDNQQGRADLARDYHSSTAAYEQAADHLEAHHAVSASALKDLRDQAATPRAIILALTDDPHNDLNPMRTEVRLLPGRSQGLIDYPSPGMVAATDLLFLDGGR